MILEITQLYQPSESGTDWSWNVKTNQWDSRTVPTDGFRNTRGTLVTLGPIIVTYISKNGETSWSEKIVRRGRGFDTKTYSSTRLSDKGLDVYFFGSADILLSSSKTFNSKEYPKFEDMTTLRASVSSNGDIEIKRSEISLEELREK